MSSRTLINYTLFSSQYNIHADVPFLIFVCVRVHVRIYMLLGGCAGMAHWRTVGRGRGDGKAQ